MRSIARADRPTADRWAARALALLVALVVCGPLLGHGYTLVADMVFVPDPAFSPRSWGGDGSVPRAVPVDALLALVGAVLPMWLVQQVLLLLATGLGVLGAWRVSPAQTLLGAAAGALAFGWGAYQAERLVMGHWSLLLGVALLPWVLRAVLTAQREDRAPWRCALLVGAGAAAAPTAGVLTSGLALVLALALPLRAAHRMVVVGSVLLFNATWVVPGLLSDARLGDDPVGVAAFATSSDTPYGVLVSALTGGGVWNRLAHLDSRAGAASAVLGLLVVVVAVAGLRGATRWWPGSGRAGVAVTSLGVVGLVLALASTTAIGADALTWATGQVPGAGLFRDAQKWLGWWLLPLSVGFGVGLERIAGWFPEGSAAFLLACGALVPMLAVPDYAWGVGGRLEDRAWPAELTQVASTLHDTPGDGAVLVLPWHAFRAWDWNDDRTVLDPWSRVLGRPVVVRDDLELVRRTVPGEDPVAAEVGAVLAAATESAGGQVDPESLRELGVRFVITDLTTAGQDGIEVPGDTLVEGERWRAVDLGPLTGAQPGGSSRLVAAVDLTAAAGLLLAALAESRNRRVGMLRFRRSTTHRRS